jgi:sec-independent protein translocase protein TatC
MAADEPDPFESTRMTLGEHLTELRRRLVRGALAVVVALFATWAYYPELTRVMQWPMEKALGEVDKEQRAKYEAKLVEERVADPSVPRTKYFRSEDPRDSELHAELTVNKRFSMLGPADGIFAAMKIAMFGAIALAGPVLLWQMWQFIAAGLYAHERRTVLLYFPMSVLLFVGGALFGYFGLCPLGFYFMIKAYPPEEMQYIAALGEYLSILSNITLALGVVFQLPLVMNALIRLDLVARDTFKKFRPHFIVVAFIVGGILTPPDPYTQTLMAVPAILLYEVGLLSTWFSARRKQPAAAEGKRAP